MTENLKIWNDMVSGRRYDATNPYLLTKLEDTRKKLRIYNFLDPNDMAGKDNLLRELLGTVGKSVVVHQPFLCDYGENIHLGDNVFINFGLTVLDEARVEIGSNVFIGPHLSIYTACHPLEVKERNRCIEWADPVTIGDNVWIGGNVTIVPGVVIAAGCVIGAGSVVTRSTEPDTLYAGNPARPIRKINN